MRINKYVATATGLSRRAADIAITDRRVLVNDQLAGVGLQVSISDTITLDGGIIKLPELVTTIMLNKPAGYVCSRSGQGSQTIYSLLPAKLHYLKPVGRLDKDSSGLLIMTNDGALANRLTHPRYAKTKIYQVSLDKALQPSDQKIITNGVQLDDGPSKLLLTKLEPQGRSWQVTMREGRNRQIRRTFAALGYNVRRLHRTSFGPYTLGDLAESSHRVIGD
ncbi:MAG TPA: pseudouridine synthase [Candidatus Dormibacteraeota bacterium]|nr:pseudouridine synthase [Candidatus Dormibacteraeota bacterium]